MKVNSNVVLFGLTVSSFLSGIAVKLLENDYNYLVYYALVANNIIIGASFYSNVKKLVEENNHLHNKISNARENIKNALLISKKIKIDL